MLVVCLWVTSADTSPIGDTLNNETAATLEMGQSLKTESNPLLSDLMETLLDISFSERPFFDIPKENERIPEYYMGRIPEGFGGVRKALLDYDKGLRLDKETRYGEGYEYDKPRQSDRGAEIDKIEKEFDSFGVFDRGEPVLRVEAERPSLRWPLSQESGFEFEKEKRLGPLSYEEADNKMVSGPSAGVDPSGFSLKRQKEILEKELAQGERADLSPVKPFGKLLFFKIGMFAAALLLLLAGTLKGLIPLRFYFFLTIFILILWNPMESLFISIIIGLSALLAPILG